MADTSQLTLAERRTLLRALETAYYRGVREVDSFGEKVVYTSRAEMRAAMNDLKASISVAEEVKRPTQTLRVFTTKGL